MAMAVVVLSALFESHIYTVSSVFLGFIARAIPLIIKEEKESFREVGKGFLFCLIGIVLVVGITWANGRIGGGSMDLGQFSAGKAGKLFLIFFGCGVRAGAMTVVKAIKVCLEKFRPQTIYLILGMMISSFYAIIHGPMTLEVPKAAMDFGSFQILSCLLGLALVAGMQVVKEGASGRD